MNPNVYVLVENGCVQNAITNVPGLRVSVRDADLDSVGEPHEFELEADYRGEDTGPITDDERTRFDREMESNFDGARTTVAVLLHLISINPPAAAFREWLKGAEEDSAAQDPDFEEES